MFKIKGSEGSEGSEGIPSSLLFCKGGVRGVSEYRREGEKASETSETSEVVHLPRGRRPVYRDRFWKDYLRDLDRYLRDSR